MKPNLPARVLIPIVVLAVGVIAALIARTGWTSLMIAAIAAVTLSGGAGVLVWSRRPGSGGFTPLVKGSDRFVLAWVAATAVLWAICAPDLYVRDAGELTGAAVGLGVPHPTGFPLLCMLGKLASLIPAGNVFFRINLLSGLAAGGACAFAALFVDRVARRSPSNPGALWWAAPVVFLGSATAWLHAVTPEIYSLSILGLAATIYLSLHGLEHRDARFIVPAAALCGIGCGGHITWPLYGAPVLVACVIAFAAGSEPGTRLRTLFRVGFLCLFAATIGAMVVLYLPAAASRDPLMNWGNPSTVEGLAAHLSGSRIRASFGDRMVSMNPAVLLVNATLAWRTVFESMAPVLPFSLAGAVLAVVRRRKWAIVPLCLVAADFLFAVFINPMGIRDLQVLLTATWSLAVLAGFGVAESVAFAAVRAGRAGAVGMASLAILLVVFQWAGAPADRDMRHVYGPRQVSDSLLDTAPGGAVAMTASDDMSSMLMARTAAEDARPDMVFLVTQHISDTRYVVRRLNPYGLDDPGSARAAAIDAIRSWPFETRGEFPGAAAVRAYDTLRALGPVLFEPGEGEADSAMRFRINPGFPLWLAAREPGESCRPDPGPWRDAISRRHTMDRWGRAYLAEWTRLYGTMEAMESREDAAIAIFRSALFLDPEDSRSAHNLGALLADKGAYDEAIDLLVSAVSIDPGYVRGWRSLAVTAATSRRQDLSEYARERELALTR